MELIREHGSRFRPSNLLRMLRAWSSYMRVELKLSLYEYYVSIRRLAGFPVVMGI